MIETNKQKLDRIKSEARHDELATSTGTRPIVIITPDDCAWLIQQAERVQELEKAKMRYKRALKHITVFPTYFSHDQHSKRALKIARKVLRGDSNA